MQCTLCLQLTGACLCAQNCVRRRWHSHVLYALGRILQCLLQEGWRGAVWYRRFGLQKPTQQHWTQRRTPRSGAGAATAAAANDIKPFLALPTVYFCREVFEVCLARLRRTATKVTSSGEGPRACLEVPRIDVSVVISLVVWFRSCVAHHASSWSKADETRLATGRPTLTWISGMCTHTHVRVSCQAPAARKAPPAAVASSSTWDASPVLQPAHAAASEAC